jgi:hypothetical protein
MLSKTKIMILTCKACKKEFERKVKHDYIPKETVYCSMPCKRADPESYKSKWTEERRKLYSEMMKGENNPNFGNTWTEDKREEFSKQKVQQYIDNPELAYECGKSNRGKKFSDERIHAMHGHRSSDSYKHYPDDETKKRIGEKSKEKFTPEFREKYRRTMEERGYWTPLDQVEPYDSYFKEANWICSMVEYFNDTEKKSLTESGFFSSKKNPKGYVRDHICPRNIGFEFKIPAYIIRHPANLQFISHAENISKGNKDRALTNEQKRDLIYALFEKIINFNGSWIEQDMCLTYIRETNSF